MNCSISINEEPRRRIETQNLILAATRERETREERNAWEDLIALKRKGRIRRTEKTSRIRSFSRWNREEIQRENKRTIRKDQTAGIITEELERCPWRVETRWHSWCQMRCQ